jgi:hypothetical protein
MTRVVVGLGACGPEADFFLREAVRLLTNHPPLARDAHLPRVSQSSVGRALAL